MRQYGKSSCHQIIQRLVLLQVRAFRTLDIILNSQLSPFPPDKPFEGYESIVFTQDGGFIAGGFAKGEYNSINDIFFKSGGQVDGAFPLAEKFSPQVRSFQSNRQISIF